MQKENRFYTLIIAPTTSSRFYKIILHHRHVYAIAIGSLIVFLLLAVMTVWVVRQAGKLARYHRIQGENQALRREYFSTLKELQSRLISIEAETHRLRQMAKEIGLSISQQSDAEDGETTSGIGGPAELESLASELERVESRLKVLRHDLTAEKVRRATQPAGWPVLGRMTAGFGVRRNPFESGDEFHSGQDISAGYGTPVRATAAGVVVHAGYRGDYGRLVVVDHGRGVTTFYGHLSTIHVSVGDHVKRGDRIGRVGSTGRSTSAHVHYEVRINDRPVNPRRFNRARR